MKKSHRLISGLLVAAASLAAVVGAQAQSSESSSRSGYGMYCPGTGYVGLNAGRSDFMVGNGVGIFNHDQGDTAYNIYAGGYFSNNFGVEIGYTDFGSVNRAGGRTKADGLNLSLVGKLPVSNMFNLLGKIGATYGRTDVSSAAGSGVTAGTENGFDWSYGVGAEYSFTPKWSAVVQYDEHYLKFPGSGRDRVSAATLGVRYGF
jgi:OOP family OmpA-OmpF porin